MATTAQAQKKSKTTSDPTSKGTDNENTNKDQDSTSSARTRSNSTEGLRKLFEHQLADLFYVENQLVKELPKMKDKAQNEQLAKTFEDHLEETKGQVKRLKTIFKIIDRPAKGEQCKAIDGILAEAKVLMEEFSDDPALDAALVLAAQKVEHYEITSYGSLCAFAEQLGLSDVCDEVEAILDEEKDADRKLSALAEEVLNLEAEGDMDGNEQHRKQFSTH